MPAEAISSPKAPRKAKKPPLVLVEWRDALSMAGWQGKDEVKEWLAAPVPVVVTAGFLLRDDAECVVVASSDSPDEHGDLNKIPRDMVVRISPLGRRAVKTLANPRQPREPAQ